jgi:hypothetical protein
VGEPGVDYCMHAADAGTVTLLLRKAMGCYACRSVHKGCAALLWPPKFGRQFGPASCAACTLCQTSQPETWDAEQLLAQRQCCLSTLLHQPNMSQALCTAAHLPQTGQAASRTCSKPSRPAQGSAQVCLCSRTWSSWPGKCPMPGAGQDAGRYYGGKTKAGGHSVHASTSPKR